MDGQAHGDVGCRQSEQRRLRSRPLPVRFELKRRSSLEEMTIWSLGTAVLQMGASGVLVWDRARAGRAQERARHRGSLRGREISSGPGSHQVERHSHAECRMLAELVETTHGPSRWPAATLPIILLKRWRQRRGAAGHRWVILGPRRVLGRGEGYAAQPRDGGGNEYGVDDDAEPELPIPEQHQKHG